MSRNIIIGVILFLCLITFPIYYGISTGKAAYRVKPEILTEERECVEPTQYMRNYHMDVLAKWKSSAIREGERIYVASDGREYTISLVGTCMGCHRDEVRFCAQCHDYVGARPLCWSCHPKPE